ncbi:MAG: argininosuccinate lyase [Planctomycetia bacterium]|nr:MAG: argininosuccinate lyase [Planctomycetia bacterium]
MFRQATDRRVEEFTESVSFDRRLYAHDIRGSIAHAQMLATIGILSEPECRQIEQGLEAIRSEIEKGDFRFCSELEDIHMHIERALVERLGDVGRKLHTGRSRNDQVSTDLRLWARENVDALAGQLRALQQALVRRAEVDATLILPAYTHMRRAQPVLAAHYFLAYCEKFDRDVARLLDCRKRLNQLPLGTAALAGTSLPVDRDDVARRLEFDGVLHNSLDASSDRDFVLELAFALAVVAEHLSGWAEEWILWSTTEYGFLKLPEAFCTGSSIMPQKVNPDVLELVRGKTARVIGNLQSLLVLVKGLPLAYNRDLQEDKLPLFDSFDTVRASVGVMIPLLEGTQWNREALSRRLDEGYLDATTLMEYLIRRGTPQRTAHHLVGCLVRRAMELGVPLAKLPLEEFQREDKQLDETVFDVLGVDKAVGAFVSYGSTGPAQVEHQLARWRKRLGEEGGR